MRVYGALIARENLPARPHKVAFAPAPPRCVAFFARPNAHEVLQPMTSARRVNANVAAPPNRVAICAKAIRSRR